jgi:methionyl-tRNA formyltransferase
LKEESFLDSLARLDSDLGVVAAYGKLLTDRVLGTPRLGLINVHASLLPRYRGAAPIHRAVINGEHETGVTIMRVVKALDAGPMLKAVKRPIHPDETSEDVERGLAVLGADAVVQAIDEMSVGTLDETPQDDAAATYAARLTKEDGAIDWSRSAPAIHNLVRGLHPWPHAFTFYRGRRLIVLRTMVGDTSDAVPGTILEAQGDRLHVSAGGGVVAIREIQVEGKRPMSVREFLAGHALAAGERLTDRP